MNFGANLVFPGALIGSLVVASLGLMITSDVKAEALIPVTASENSNPGSLVDPVNSEAESEPANPEDLFEASIAFTPDTPSEGLVSQDAGGQCRVSDQFPPSILQWCEIITKYAEQHNMPADLIAAVMVQESGGKPLAYSHSGAVGLMQVMPRDGIAAKFMCKNGPCFTSRPTIDELQDPEFNVAYGTRMLAGLADRFGNYRDALKSYGPMDVGYYYADKVLAIYDRYGQ